MKTAKNIIIAGLFVIFVIIGNNSFAEGNNRKKVMANVERGWNKTIWGETINDAEYLRFTAAVASAVVTENPEPVIQYFKDLARRNIAKIQQEAGNIGSDILWKVIIDGIKYGKVTKFNTFELKAGLATWQRWQRVVYDEPRTKKCKYNGPFGTWTWGVCTTSERVEKEIPPPNWHRPYVSIRYKRTSTKKNSHEPIVKRINKQPDNHAAYPNKKIYTPKQGGSLYTDPDEYTYQGIQDLE